MKKKISIILASSFLVLMLAFSPKGTDQKPWPVPDADKNKVNPLKGDAASIATGKALYNTHCKSCHGTKGKGDGAKAEKIDISCGDFSSAEFAKISDGEIFWKTTEGRKPMPSYKEKLSNNERWAIVNYMRTLEGAK